jgi:putative tryptophan/tyrosine transport system substrate-binding protein
MRRREFIALVGSAAAAWPLAARAQQDRVRRIGVIAGMSENDPQGQLNMQAFRQGLLERGLADGRNLKIEYRFHAADADSIRAARPTSWPPRPT